MGQREWPACRLTNTRHIKDFIRTKLKKLKVKDVDWTNASDPTPDNGYNCFGMAVGVLRWWESPDIRGGVNLTPYVYWPKGLPLNDSIDAYIAAARLQGFELCTEQEDDCFLHAARYVGDGKLLSKCGNLSDFEHPLDAMDDCSFYGSGLKVHGESAEAGNACGELTSQKAVKRTHRAHCESGHIA